MLKIEKNVNLPPRKHGKEKLYPLNEMKVGESFFLPCKNNKMCYRRQSHVHTAAKRRGLKKRGMRFITRKVKGGMRCWRIK